jgi:hypothetical protein
LLCWWGGSAISCWMSLVTFSVKSSVSFSTCPTVSSHSDGMSGLRHRIGFLGSRPLACLPTLQLVGPQRSDGQGGRASLMTHLSGSFLLSRKVVKTSNLKTIFGLF